MQVSAFVSLQVVPDHGRCQAHYHDLGLDPGRYPLLHCQEKLQSYWTDDCSAVGQQDL